MIKQQSSYIYSIEGKDILLANRDYKTKKGKKFKGALDYSLLAIKLDELDTTVCERATYNFEGDPLNTDMATPSLSVKIYSYFKIYI